MLDDVCVNDNDIGNFVVGSNFFEDRRRSEILENIWTPPIEFHFPLTQIGSKKRKFNPAWIQKYHWLSYSKIDDGAYCRYCVLFSKKLVGHTSSQLVGVLCTEPFKNWKNAIEKFENHQNTSYHKNSILFADNLKAVLENPGRSIENKLNQEAYSQSLENRKKLTPIIKTIIFCGQNNLPLRGHKDSGTLNVDATFEEQQQQKGIGLFKKLLLFRVDSGDESLRNHLETAGDNATYLSPIIQNEIIELCNNII